MRYRAIAAVLMAAAPFAGAAPVEDQLLSRGEYMYRAAGCAGCHSDVANGGLENAGGVAIESPFGVFYGPNITPDRQHGIGGWSEADFTRALRYGVSPSGQHYYPAFPYTSYTRIADGDIRALWAYLRSRPAVARRNRPHDVAWYIRFRPALALWKRRYFTPGTFAPDPGRSPRLNRGAYLAAAAHCVECHTPRDIFGGLKRDLYYAGAKDAEGIIPNITPAKKTGIGGWSEEELAKYLGTGRTPDGDSAGDLMADVIDDGLRYLTDADRRAIAAYILSLPAIEHEPR